MINIGCEYNIKEDINFILETERINSADLSERSTGLILLKKN